MIHIEPRMDLLFIYSPGCEACEAAEPEIDRFNVMHPNLVTLKIRADGTIASMLYGKRVRATPTYVLRRAGHGHVKEGAMTAEELTAWIESLIASES